MKLRSRILKAFAVAAAVAIGAVSSICVEKPVEVGAGVVSTITIPSNFYQLNRVIGNGNKPMRKTITLTKGNTYILELAGGQGGPDSYYYNGLGSPSEVRTNLRGGYGGYQRIKFSVDRNITLELDAGGAGTADSVAWPDGQQNSGGAATYVWILNSSGGRTLLAAAGGGAGASGGVSEFMGFNGGNGHALGQSGAQNSNLITAWPATAGAESTRYNGQTWTGWKAGNDSSAFGLKWASTIKANFDAMIPGKTNLEGHARWRDGASSLPYREDYIGEDISVTRSKTRFFGDPNTTIHAVGGGGGIPAGTCSYYGFSGWYREGTMSGYSGWVVDDPINRISTGGYGYLLSDAQASTLGIKNLQCVALDEPDGTGTIPNSNAGTGRGNGMKASGVENNAASLGIQVTKHKGQGYVYLYKKLATVTINPNGGVYKGSSMTQSHKADPNTDEPIPVPTRPGYIFTGWTVVTTPPPGNPPGTLDHPGPGDNTLHIKEDDIIIIGQWSEISYPIVYHSTTHPRGVQPSNANSVVNSIGNKTSYKVSDSTFKINNPSASGYRFLGWTTTETAGNYNNNYYVYKGTVPNSSDGKLHLWAHWEKMAELPLKATPNFGYSARAWRVVDSSGTTVNFNKGTVDLNWSNPALDNSVGGYYLSKSSSNTDANYVRWTDKSGGVTQDKVPDVNRGTTTRALQNQTTTDSSVWDKGKPNTVDVNKVTVKAHTEGADAGRYTVNWYDVEDTGTTYWFKVEALQEYFGITDTYKRILILAGCPFDEIKDLTYSQFQSNIRNGNKSGHSCNFIDCILYGHGKNRTNSHLDSPLSSAAKMFRYHYIGDGKLLPYDWIADNFVYSPDINSYQRLLNYFAYCIGDEFYAIKSGYIIPEIMPSNQNFGASSNFTVTAGSFSTLNASYIAGTGIRITVHADNKSEVKYGPLIANEPPTRYDGQDYVGGLWGWSSIGIKVSVGSNPTGYQIGAIYKKSSGWGQTNNWVTSSNGETEVTSDIQGRIGKCGIGISASNAVVDIRDWRFKGGGDGVEDGYTGSEVYETSNTAGTTVTSGLSGYLVRETNSQNYTIGQPAANATISEKYIPAGSGNTYKTAAIVPTQEKWIHIAPVDKAGNVGATIHKLIYKPGGPGAEPGRYNVVYDGNGATAGSVTPQNNLEFNVQYTYKPNGFTREGYKFKGWSLTEDGSGKPGNPGTVAPGSKYSNLCTKNGDTVTVYAIWEPISYKVHYNPNGGTTSRPGLVSEAPNPETHKYDENFNLKTKIYYRKGHVLERWSKATPISPDDFNNIPSMSVKTYNLGENVRNIADAITTDGQTVELHAVWRKKVFWIQFDGNENTSGEDPDPIKGEWDKPIQLPDPPYEKEGYEFVGWEFGPVDNDPGTDYPYDPDDDRYEDKPDGTGNPTGGKITNPIPPGKDDIEDGEVIILHAKWRKKVTLRYDYNQGLDSAGNSTNYTWGYIYNNMDAITFDIISTEPTRYPVSTSVSPTGYLYDFKGWTVNPVLYPDENKNPWEEHFIRNEPDGLDADGNPKFKRIYCKAGEFRWTGSTILGPVIDAADGGGTRADKYTITGLKNNTKNEEWIYGVWKVRHWSGAGVSRTLGPNSDPIVFQRGERGIVRVDGKGFVDKIDITFPGAIAKDEHYDTIIDPYDKMDGHYDHSRPDTEPDYIDDVLDNFTKGHGFNIPLYFGGDNWSDQLDNTIHIDVHFTYKGDETVHPYDFKYIVSETVLDELRTRIRIRLREPETP